MDKNKQIDNKFHLEKDKRLVPFLLTSHDINYHGTRLIGQTVFFIFSPVSEVKKVVNQFYSRESYLVPAKDLLDNVERFRNEIIKKKNIFTP